MEQYCHGYEYQFIWQQKVTLLLRVDVERVITLYQTETYIFGATREHFVRRSVNSIMCMVMRNGYRRHMYDCQYEIKGFERSCVGACGKNFAEIV